MELAMVTILDGGAGVGEGWGTAGDVGLSGGVWLSMMVGSGSNGGSGGSMVPWLQPAKDISGSCWEEPRVAACGCVRDHGA
ncbi:hypothetical protein V6N11_084100 [Hibiscus sabdariffa]|uniref:Uncharacterized protein n=1 Tax=Hibiscus sabdariffa TaxID=183260 RepID=A0ABR2QDX8_9ROSI